jgi:hypothetical protein
MFAADDNYAKYIPPLQVSLYKNHPDTTVNVFALSVEPMSPRSKGFIEETAARYGRRVTFVDNDTCAFGENAIIAHKTVSETVLSEQTLEEDMSIADKLAERDRLLRETGDGRPTKLLFGAGVQLYNLSKWRELGWTAEYWLERVKATSQKNWRGTKLIVNDYRLLNEWGWPYCRMLNYRRYPGFNLNSFPSGLQRLEQITTQRAR